MTDDVVDPTTDAAGDRHRYRRLPPAVRLEDTIAVKETEAAPDPESGQDTERAFMLRYAG
jgi:hypothetical protein